MASPALQIFTGWLLVTGDHNFWQIEFVIVIWKVQLQSFNNWDAAIFTYQTKQFEHVVKFGTKNVWIINRLIAASLSDKNNYILIAISLNCSLPVWYSNLYFSMLWWQPSVYKNNYCLAVCYDLIVLEKNIFCHFFMFALLCTLIVKNEFMIKIAKLWSQQCLSGWWTQGVLYLNVLQPPCQRITWFNHDCSLPGSLVPWLQRRNRHQGPPTPPPAL